MDRVLRLHPGFATWRPCSSLVVVPGVASAPRTWLLAANLKRLNATEPCFKCVVFRQSHVGDKPELDSALEQSGVSRACEVIVSTNPEPAGYISHLKRVPPPLVEAGRFGFVFILLDDVELTDSFDFALLRHLVAANRLSVVTPAVHNATIPSMLPHPLPTQALRSRPRGVGRLITRFEMFSVGFTPLAWRCFYALLDAAVNPIGWGYDSWQYDFCSRWPGLDHRVGVIDAMGAVHQPTRLLPPSPSSSAAAAPSDDARPGARRAARKRRRAAKSGPRTIANPEAGRTYSTRIAHEQMDAMAAKWKARGVKLVEANYKLQKLPGPNGVVYMSE